MCSVFRRLNLSYQERFKGKQYPECLPYCHTPNIVLGFQPKAGAYRLFCTECLARSENAIRKVLFSPEERENAVELEPKSN